MATKAKQPTKPAATEATPSKEDHAFCWNCGQHVDGKAKVKALNVVSNYCTIHGQLLRANGTCPRKGCYYHTRPVGIGA